MKRFIAGLSTGYLLTSLFSISAPPATFWFWMGMIFMLYIPIGYVRHRLNDDLHDGDY